MEVILLEDVKGKGKKDQVIKVNNGYGNFLISNNKAVISNQQNVDLLEEKLEQKKIEEKEKLENSLKIKEVLDQKIIKINLKAGVGGKTFGTITTKQISEILFNETGIKIDKKRMSCSVVMNSLGNYKLDVEVQTGVHAILTVQILDSNAK